jgi:predicted metal-dependent hydrolase
MLHHTISTTSGAFEYQLNRSKKRRRSMEVRIRPEGIVEVQAPASYSMAVIEGFLRRKSDWVIAKLAVCCQRQALMQERSAQANRECFYLGKSYPVVLDVKPARWGRIVFSEDGWSVEVPDRIAEDARHSYVRTFMEKWFKSNALNILQERVRHYAGLMDDAPEAVRIRSPRSLWGSCHPSKRVLHFNWKIVMAPIDVIDYLVVHELSHLKVANHSKRFWARVLAFCPQYKTSQAWLRRNGYELQLPFSGGR